MTDYPEVLNDPTSNDPNRWPRRGDPSIIDIEGYGQVNACPWPDGRDNDPTDQTLDVVEDGLWVRRSEYTLDDR
jgi:hypothetical protein